MVDRREAGLLLLTALTVVAAAATLVAPYALAAVADSVRAGELDWPSLGLLLAAGAVQILASGAAALLAAGVTARLTARLRRGLTRQLCGFGTASPPGIGAARRGFSADCATAGTRPALLAALVSAVLVSSGSVVLLAILDWRLVAAFVLGVSFAVPLAAHARHNLDVTDADGVDGADLGEHRPASELSALLRQAVAGLRTIADSGITEHEARRVLRPLPLMHAAGADGWRTAARATWPARLAVPFTCFAVLCAAGFGVAVGRLTVGELLAACCYAALGLSVVTRIGLVGELARARASAGRVAELCAAPAPRAGTAKLPPGNGTIVLRGVSVGTTLREVDLTVRAGSAVAVVGRSAVGTEALAAVLGGLRPVDAGEVLLDGIPMAELAPAQLRSAVSYAPARPRLVGTSFADAIGYGSWAGSRAVGRACAAAGVGGLVARLPYGHHTSLRYLSLSEEETRRLGLARAIVRGPRVLIAERAHGADDLAFRSLRGKTRVVVTDSMTTAESADTVVWLAHGRVRAVAKHEDLLAQPAYRAVFAQGGPP
ncbi:ABC transporter ATP-binding protein [Saccharomonospora sp. NPDC006951]